MQSRRILSAVAAALFAVAGCQNKQDNQAQEPQPSPDALLAGQPAPAPADPAPSADPVMDDITLLAQKTEAHARRIAADLEHHPLPQSAGPGAGEPAPELDQIADPKIPDPPVTEWLDPRILSLNPAPFPPADAAPAPRQTVAQPAIHPNTPSAPSADRGSANQAVAIANDDLIASNTGSSAADPLETRPAAATESGPSVSPSMSADASALQRALAQRIAEDPNDPVAHLEYQLLRYIEGKQVPDLGTLASLPREDQEIVTAILDSLSNFRNNLRADSNLLLSRKVKPLMDLGDRLRAQADLEIPTLLLARRVDGFGVYEPIEHRFVAGRDRDVIIYCEVANFMSQLTEQQQWETRLTEEVVLYTDTDGLPILRDKPTVVPDLSRNRRHDFFIVRRLRLPANIPVGRYWLKVTVVDQLASRVAEASIPITFVAN